MNTVPSSRRLVAARVVAAGSVLGVALGLTGSLPVRAEPTPSAVAPASASPSAITASPPVPTGTSVPSTVASGVGPELGGVAAAGAGILVVASLAGFGVIARRQG